MISTTGFFIFRGLSRWRRSFALAAPLSGSSDTRLAVAQSPIAIRASLRISGRWASSSDAEPHATDSEEALDASAMPFPLALCKLCGEDVPIEVGFVVAELSWAEKTSPVGDPNDNDATSIGEVARSRRIMSLISRATPPRSACVKGSTLRRIVVAVEKEACALMVSWTEAAVHQLRIARTGDSGYCTLCHSGLVRQLSSLTRCSRFVRPIYTNRTMLIERKVIVLLARVGDLRRSADAIIECATTRVMNLSVARRVVRVSYKGRQKHLVINQQFCQGLASLGCERAS